MHLPFGSDHVKKWLRLYVWKRAYVIGEAIIYIGTAFVIVAILFGLPSAWTVFPTPWFVLPMLATGIVCWLFGAVIYGLKLKNVSNRALTKKERNRC